MSEVSAPKLFQKRSSIAEDLRIRSFTIRKRNCSTFLAGILEMPMIIRADLTISGS